MNPLFLYICYYTYRGPVCQDCVCVSRDNIKVTTAQSCHKKCSISISGNYIVGTIFGKKIPPPPPPTK